MTSMELLFIIFSIAGVILGLLLILENLYTLFKGRSRSRRFNRKSVALPVYGETDKCTFDLSVGQD
jgi:hypothetical protein